MVATLPRPIASAVRAVYLRGPLAKDQRAQLFHNLLLALVAWFALATIVSAPFSPITVFRIAAVLTMEVALAGALILLRMGWFRHAGMLYLAGTWLFATLVIAFNGGIRSPVQTFYVTLPISAAWLFGYGGALWTAGVCLATVLVLAVIAAVGVPMPVRIPGTPLGLWAVFVQACLIGVVPVAQVLRALTEALNQSQAKEEELSRYRRHLEELVEQRTAELVLARDEAQAANRAKSVFLANISHELRTPLNAILGFSGLARDRASSEEQFNDLDAITRSGEHLLALINDLLDIAKIESGREVLRNQALELGLLVSDVVAMMRARAEQKHLALVVETPGFPLPVQAGVLPELRRILINLVGNAIRYTQKRISYVSVKLQRLPMRPGGSF